MFKPKQKPVNDEPSVTDGGDGSVSPQRHGNESTPVQMQEIEMSDEAADLVKQLQAELDEAVEARKRALADFRNYQRRSLENEQRAGQSGAMRIVKAVLPALDHFDLAL